jgi:hypothetical protein
VTPGAASFAAALLLVLPAAAEGPASAPDPRFVDLDRLYFDRTDDPGAGWIHAEAVRSLLPAMLAPDALSLELRLAEETETDVEVQDFRLPWPGESEVLLRQVVDLTHRIAEQWWALYGDGRRSECWHFAPAPTRTEGKLLASLQVARVSSAADGFTLHTCGQMFRPQGAFWLDGRDLQFTVSDGEIRLAQVLTRFYVYRGYDLGKTPPPYFKTERVIVPGRDGESEIRSLDDPPQRVLRQCGFEDPHLADEPLSCAGWEEAARCITDRPRARTARRRLAEPSFIERGGRAPQRRE